MGQRVGHWRPAQLPISKRQVQFLAMNPPRWFWYVVAASLVLVTVAASVRLLRPAADEWQLRDGGTIFNPSSGVYCHATTDPDQRVCFDLRGAGRSYEWFSDSAPKRTPG